MSINDTEKAIELLKGVEEYLDGSKLNSLGSGSIGHKEIKQAINLLEKTEDGFVIKKVKGLILHDEWEAWDPNEVVALLGGFIYTQTCWGLDQKTENFYEKQITLRKCK